MAGLSNSAFLDMHEVDVRTDLSAQFGGLYIAFKTNSTKTEAEEWIMSLI